MRCGVGDPKHGKFTAGVHCPEVGWYSTSLEVTKRDNCVVAMDARAYPVASLDRHGDGCQL